VICDECLLGSAVDWVILSEVVYFSPCIAGGRKAFQPRSLL
jgi:hypothetical protein